MIAKPSTSIILIITVVAVVIITFGYFLNTKSIDETLPVSESIFNPNSEINLNKMNSNVKPEPKQAMVQSNLYKTGLEDDSKLHICDNSIIQSYNSAYNSAVEGNPLEWCKEVAKAHQVRIGHSWGSLPSNLKVKWDTVNCNE
jgi:hypothetical protein